MAGIKIDRDLVIPVRQQIRAVLVHQISGGELAPGAPLPSVRELAESSGVAPMTVSKVYAELKEAGLVEARVGAGTFVADSALARLGSRGGIAAIWAEIDAVVERTLAAGLGPVDAVAMLNARAIHRLAAGRRRSFVMVGLFEAATRSYARRVAEQVAGHATVTPLVLDDAVLPEGPESALLRSADLIVTFGTLRERIEALAPGVPVMPIRFIPAELTRMALASLDPMARVAVVSRFVDFLPVLELGVKRFAPHVQRIAALDLAAPDLAAAVATADVVVMSTGAEAAGEMAPPGAVKIEYRHIPDPGDVARLVLPLAQAGPDQAATASGDRKEAS